MSIGIGGLCRKVAEDATTVLYEYYSYNLNEEHLRNPDKIADGSIFIRKSCLVEPEIHSKTKRMPNGKKKLVEKRIAVEVNLSDRLLSGDVEIKNCSHVWRVNSDGIDEMALRICRSLFEEYQKSGSLPDICGFDS